MALQHNDHRDAPMITSHLARDGNTHIYSYDCTLSLGTNKTKSQTTSDRLHYEMCHNVRPPVVPIIFCCCFSPLSVSSPDLAGISVGVCTVTHTEPEETKQKEQLYTSNAPVQCVLC